MNKQSFSSNKQRFSENKKLRFVKELVPLILSGEKTVTWRFWDDKDLSVGDTLDLYETGEETPFAQVKVTEVFEKALGKLTPEDMLGHERFESDEEMYRTFTKYYKKEVTPKSLVKIVRFELI